MSTAEDYLIVQDVPAVVAWFRDQLGLAARVSQERYAELEAGPRTIILRTDAPGQAESPALQMMHLQVNDVAGAVERAQARGLTVIPEVTRTAQGIESAKIVGPENIVIDFFRRRDEDAR